MTVAGVVLAAGAGTRMGQPKAELVVSERRLLDGAVSALLDGGCDPVVAVVRDGGEADGAECVVNLDPERGMRSSLELGISAVADANVDAIAVMLVDTPGITATAVRAVLDGRREGRIAIGRIGSRRVHPTVMSLELWRAALVEAGPDEGARRFLAEHPELVDEIEVAGIADDLDTPEDLAAWRSRGSEGYRGL